MPGLLAANSAHLAEIPGSCGDYQIHPMNLRPHDLRNSCPMPVLMTLLGLEQYARALVRSPFRPDSKPSWGIFNRNGRWFFKDLATGESGDEITLLAKVKGLDVRRDFRQLLKIYADLAGLRPQ